MLDQRSSPLRKLTIWNGTDDVDVHVADARGRIVFEVPAGVRRSTRLHARRGEFTIRQRGVNGQPIAIPPRWSACYLAGNATEGVQMRDAAFVGRAHTWSTTNVVLSVVALCALVGAAITGGLLWARRRSPPRSGLEVWNHLPSTAQVVWGH